MKEKHIILLLYRNTMNLYSDSFIYIGDIHQDPRRLKIAIDYANKRGITKLITLGDEGPRSNQELNEIKLRELYALLIDFAKSPENELFCLHGNNTILVPPELYPYFIGYDDKHGANFIRNDSPHENFILNLEQQNIIAAHKGEYILEYYEELIKNYDKNNPLIILNAHTHSIDVSRDYRKIPKDERVKYIDQKWENEISQMEGFSNLSFNGNISEARFKLEPRKVYWINPGPNNIYDAHTGMYLANFGIYNPAENEIIQTTIKFN